jgi:hypothetical protein
VYIVCDEVFDIRKALLFGLWRWLNKGEIVRRLALFEHGILTAAIDTLEGCNKTGLIDSLQWLNKGVVIIRLTLCKLDSGSAHFEPTTPRVG